SRDHVRTAEPVGFGEVGLRPLRGMVGVRVVEADDVFVAGAAFALDADQFLRVNAVAVLRGVGAGIAAAGGREDDADVTVHGSQQNAAAFVRVGFFAVAADFGVVG